VPSPSKTQGRLHASLERHHAGQIARKRLLGPKMFTVSTPAERTSAEAQRGNGGAPSIPSRLPTCLHRRDLDRLNDQIQLFGRRGNELILGADGRFRLKTVGYDNGDPLWSTRRAGGGDEPLPTRRSPAGPRGDGRGVPLLRAEGRSGQFTPTAGRIGGLRTPLVDDKRSAPSKYIFYDAKLRAGHWRAGAQLGWPRIGPRLPGKLKFTAGSNTIGRSRIGS